MSTTDLTSSLHCDRCGAELEPGARYCSNCGQAVATATEPSPPVPVYWSDPTPQQPAIPPLSASFESGGGIGQLVSASGRISRLEYFLIVLGIWIVLMVAWGIVIVVDAPLLTILLGFGTWLAAIVVAVCAGVKRLHDFDQSGWLYLLMLIPFAGFILLLVLLFKGGTDGMNRYGFADSGSVMG